MTDFEKRVFNAADQFQTQLDPFGLSVYRNGYSGQYRGDSLTEFIVSLTSEPVPAKGKKGLIEQLRAAGLHVETYTRTDWNTGKRFFVFQVRKEFVIPTMSGKQGAGR